MSEDTYLLELVRYIHLNPIRLGVIKNLMSSKPGALKIVNSPLTEAHANACPALFFLVGQRQAVDVIEGQEADAVVLGDEIRD